MQAAKTYLERNFEEFAGADVDALLQHSLKVGTNPLNYFCLWCQLPGADNNCLAVFRHAIKVQMSSRISVSLLAVFWFLMLKGLGYIPKQPVVCWMSSYGT